MVVLTGSSTMKGFHSESLREILIEILNLDKGNKLGPLFCHLRTQVVQAKRYKPGQEFYWGLELN